MTNEEKQLLLIDLCARLPYGVIVAYKSQESEGQIKLGYGNIGYVAELGRGWWIDCKPYLRPMSSMTQKEEEDLKQIIEIELNYLASGHVGHTVESAASSTFEIDFYNSHHFDFRGLIPMGLALEAKEGMYEIK